MSFMGLDVGTTGCKAVVFNEDAEVLSSAYREYPLLHPRPGWSELDPEFVWQRSKEVIAQVNERVKRDPVEAVSISVQGEAVTPIDRDGKSLYNFSVSFDHRTVEQYQWWKQEMGKEQVFQITGMSLHPMHTINKLMWFKRNRPEILERTWKFLCVEDYVIYRLSGQLATDPSIAARTMAYDVVKRRWSEQMLRRAEIDPDLLPPVFDSGTPVGTVQRRLAEELGFGEHVCVATGGHDQPCGALGAGVIRPGLAMNATGTSDVLCPVLEHPLLTSQMLRANYCCYPHVWGKRYCSIGFNLTGGLLLRWYRDTLCSEEKQKAEEQGRDAYEIILEEMSDGPRDLYFLPHFVGSGTPTLDPLSRGAILGLTVDTRKPHLARAVIDSVDYEMRLNIEKMEEAGMAIDQIRAIGGGAKSPLWLQMKADVFG
jgi:xylulokinase